KRGASLLTGARTPRGLRPSFPDSGWDWDAERGFPVAPLKSAVAWGGNGSPPGRLLRWRLRPAQSRPLSAPRASSAPAADA
ncbi:hypothetical protein P7K49_008332, partial [Saguinus oedipus]